MLVFGAFILGPRVITHISPGSCLLPAPGLMSALALGFLMKLHRMNTGGSKSSDSSTGAGICFVFCLFSPWESWLNVVQGETQI